MSNRPRLATEGSFLPGVLAVVLFALMAAITLNTQFGEMAGFPEGISIVSEIGYAMFNLTPLQSGEGAIGDTEPFLAAFLLIAVLLDAALDASLVLAKREEGGEAVSPLSTQHGTSDVTPTAGAVTDGGSSSSVDADSSGDLESNGGERR